MYHTQQFHFFYIRYFLEVAMQVSVIILQKISCHCTNSKTDRVLKIWICFRRLIVIIGTCYIGTTCQIGVVFPQFRPWILRFHILNLLFLLNYFFGFKLYIGFIFRVILHRSHTSSGSEGHGILFGNLGFIFDLFLRPFCTHS